MTTTTVTPLEVLDMAIEELSKPGGFTPATYHAGPMRHGGIESTCDLSTATAHCAIGGVEHAIWKLTTVDVQMARHALAYTGRKDHIYSQARADNVLVEADPEERPALEVYAQVMELLNETAVKMTRAGSFVDYDGDPVDPEEVDDIEDLSFHADKESVLEVFKVVRERLALAAV
jgi:hypothetical protein